MKRIIALLLTVVLAFGLTACKSADDKNPSASQITSTQGVSQEQGFEKYIGTWSESDISFEKGGFILDINVENNSMKLDFQYSSWVPNSYVAELNENINLSNIEDNVLIIAYDEDGWGNSGAVEVVFGDSYIMLDFKNIVYNDMANWGFNEGTYKLIKNDQAHAIIAQGEKEYYENSTPVETPPTYDMTKASGILASLGMTEQEFRNSCQALNHSKYHYHLDEKTTVPYVEIVDLQRNPNAYIGQHFVFAKNPFEELPCKYCHGEDLTRIPQKECSHQDIFGNRAKLHDDGLYYYMQDNLNKLVPYELSGRDRFTNAYGESVITGVSYDIFYVYDVRDDIYSPTITKDSKVVAYMIFDGITSNNMLQFSMISCDVIYDD